MHSAPSVSFPVGRSRFARRLLWGVWSLGAASLLAWCFQFDGAPWRTAFLLAAVVLAALAAWRGARPGEAAQLRWDGRHWSCTGNVSLNPAAASVHLDLQSLMLVRLRQSGRGAAWLWLDRASDPSRWLDLRRALLAAGTAYTDALDGVPQP